MKDSLVGPCLDLIRIITNPSTSNYAHITVRGPYKGKAKKTRNWRAFRADEIEFRSIGTFFTDSQNTVFINCVLDRIERIWRKPDYRNGTCHLTLYDGESPEFARRLTSELRKYDWNFSVPGNELELLISKKREKDFLIYINEANEMYQEIFSSDFSWEKIQNLNDEDRLSYVGIICKYIEDNVEENRMAHNKSMYEL